MPRLRMACCHSSFSVTATMALSDSSNSNAARTSWMSTQLVTTSSVSDTTASMQVRAWPRHHRDRGAPFDNGLRELVLRRFVERDARDEHRVLDAVLLRAQ